MNTSSVVLWLAEAPWGYALAGRWTALLILAWVAHLVLAKRDPRWRVLVWRSAAVGLATIVILTATPPIVTWRLPRAESIVGPVASSESVVPLADPLPVPRQRPAQVVDPQTSTPALPRRSESAKRSSGGLGSRSDESGHDRAEPRGLFAGDLAARSRRDGVPAGALRLARVEDRATVHRGPSQCLRGVPRRRRRARLPSGRSCRPDGGSPRTLPDRPVSTVASVAGSELRQRPTAPISGPSSPMSSPTRDATTWSGTWSFISGRSSFGSIPWCGAIRTAHLAACDAVCDALAADLVGDVASYGRTLARLALQVAGPAPVPGLAMAGTPDVFLRIEALRRRVFRGALPRRTHRACSACYWA